MLAQYILNCFGRWAFYVKRALILIPVFMCFGFTQTEVDELAEARIKALFIYNFVKYIHWPENEPYDIFTIGIVGKSQTFTELKRICQNKNIKGKTINVIQIAETEKVDECQAIFITRSQSFLIEDILDVIDKNATLVITESKGMLKQGSSINLVKQGTKDAFEIRKDALQKQGLKIPENLLVLAVNDASGSKF